MRFETVEDWLNWQQSLNPKGIELGLDRVNQVYRRLNPGQIAAKVITVSGTNGKGSTVAYYETWLHNSGFKVASYTSPHLMKYNERIKLNLHMVSDKDLCLAFAVVDEAREDVALTYFEFGTLAALYLISQFQPDVAILEVGLGGRLDAVNIIDADLAHITPIGLDHQDWLGATRELIGREKAGILRQHGLAVCNDVNPPDSVLEEIDRLQCRSSIIVRDYIYQRIQGSRIEWSDGKHSLSLEPPLKGEHQALNISGVLAGLSLLGFLEERSEREIATAFKNVVCAGRFQRIESDLPAQLWVDVGHNEDAAAVLAKTIKGLNCKGRVIVLLGMLSDKNPAGFVAKLNPVVDEWWLLGLAGERGLSGQQLAERIGAQAAASYIFDSAENCVEHAVLSLNNQDILLVTGSFLTVQAMLTVL